MELATQEVRDTLVDPPAALCYRWFPQDDSNAVVASALGGLVVVQEVGKTARREEAMSYYDNADVFDPWYARAVELAAGFLEYDLDDLSFSFLWHALDGPTEVEWRYVRLPTSARPILLEATLVWCLAEVVDNAIRRLPLERAEGAIDRTFVTQALDLFALDNPQQVWTNQEEIEQASRLYEAWKLGERIAESRSRFDQAASGFSFFWEAAERRRETTLTLAVSVVAVVGLLQADQQLHRLTRLSVDTVDRSILALAIVLVLLIVWRTVLMPRRAEAVVRKRWETLADRMAQP